MSNGHGPKDGIKFVADTATVIVDGVAFRVGDVQPLVEYFAKYPGQSFNVTATVVGDAGSTDDTAEAPVTGS